MSAQATTTLHSSLPTHVAVGARPRLHAPVQITIASRMLVRASTACRGCSPRPARDSTAHPPLVVLAQLAS
ncbi:hypothetical protein ZWY2020_053022 [Hordeum vulgare]|nr:hypothetical protein ZWY2020_053022 [Hordeum vulgare]